MRQISTLRELSNLHVGATLKMSCGNIVYLDHQEELLDIDDKRMRYESFDREHYPMKVIWEPERTMNPAEFKQFKAAPDGSPRILPQGWEADYTPSVPVALVLSGR